MDDHIIKAAREAGWQFLQLEMAAPAEVERLSRFYAIAFKAGMERAAEICETEWSNVAEKMYGEECANAIRAEAHAKNQPESTHDTDNV